MRRGHSLISRPRLVDRAKDVLDSRVTLLVAPSGSGKSTLLDQWTERLEGTADVVRLNLGFEHNDPVRFQADLIAAAAPALPLLPPDPGEITPASLIGFAAAMQARRHPERPLVVIFDQFERIVDAIIPDTIMTAVQLAPPDTIAVFSGRVAPNILLADFYSQGTVLEVGFEQLRLNRDELAMLAAARRQVSDAVLDEVERETLGWTVAARHLLQGGASRLAEYIDEEVLSGLSGRGRRLLEEAAVPESIPPAQAETIFGIDAQGHIGDLTDLHGVHLPLVRAVEPGHWCLPPVLRRRLLQHLGQRDPVRLRALQDQQNAVDVGPLSPREREVLGLLDEGLTIAAVARQLGVSFHTVKAHVRSIHEKLGVSTRVLALQRARAMGLLHESAEAAPGAARVGAG